MSSSVFDQNIGEFGLIELLQSKLSPLEWGVGIGDDCAVLPLSTFTQEGVSGSLLMTTDSLVEGTHFRIEKISGSDLGFKTLAASMSDIAAMGGVPRAANVALHVNEVVSRSYLEALYLGLEELAHREGVAIVGGDTVRAREFSISLTLLGVTSAKPILRSGAKVGDTVWLSGIVGASGLGLAVQEGKIASSPSLEPYLKIHHRPEPQVKLGKMLGELGFVNAMIDLSDGMLQDATHIAHASGVTLELDVSRIPTPRGVSPERWGIRESLCSGEDYQLLFTANPCFSSKLRGLSPGLELAPVGQVVACEPEVPIWILDEDGSRLSAHKWLGGASQGFQHF